MMNCPLFLILIFSLNLITIHSTGSSGMGHSRGFYPGGKKDEMQSSSLEEKSDDESCSYSQISEAWLTTRNFATCTGLDMEELESLKVMDLQNLQACLANDETSMAQCQAALEAVGSHNDRLAAYLDSIQSDPFGFCQCFRTGARGLPDCGTFGPMKTLGQGLSNSCLYLFKGCDYTSMYNSCFTSAEEKSDSFCSQVYATCSDLVLAPLKCQSEVEAGLWGQMQKYATECASQIQDSMSAAAPDFTNLPGGEEISFTGGEDGSTLISQEMLESFASGANSFFNGLGSFQDGDNSLIDGLDPASIQEGANSLLGDLDTGAAWNALVGSNQGSNDSPVSPSSEQSSAQGQIHNQQEEQMQGGAGGQAGGPPIQPPQGGPASGDKNGVPPECLRWVRHQGGGYGGPPRNGSMGAPGMPPPPADDSSSGAPRGQYPPPPMGQGPPPNGQNGQGPPMDGQGGQGPPMNGQGPPMNGQGGPPMNGGQRGPPPMNGQGDSQKGMQNGQAGQKGQNGMGAPPSYCLQYIQDQQGGNAVPKIGGWIFLTLVAISVLGVGAAFFISRRRHAHGAASKMRRGGYMQTITEEPDDVEMSPMAVGGQS